MPKADVPTIRTIPVEELVVKLALLAREADRRANQEDLKGPMQRDMGRIRGLHLASNAFRNLIKWAESHGIEEPPL